MWLIHVSTGTYNISLTVGDSFESTSYKSIGIQVSEQEEPDNEMRIEGKRDEGISKEEEDNDEDEEQMQRNQIRHFRMHCWKTTQSITGDLYFLILTATAS